MDTLLRVSAAAIVGAILVAVIKKQNSALALALSLACCCLLAAFLLELVQPVLDFAGRLRETAGLSGAFWSPLLKTVAVGLVTEIASSVCADAGETALSRIAGLCGCAAALCCALPLMEAVLELIAELLEA